MTDQRNLILAVAISIAIVLGFQYFYEVPRVQQLADQQAAQQAQEPAPVPGAEALLPSDVPAPPGTPVTPVTTTAVAAASRDAVLAEVPRVRIESPRLHGSITLTGGRIDDLTLADYRETTDPESPEITLLSPAGATRAYYAEFGWVPAESGTAVPVATTEWRADRGTLAPGEPVTLSWDNGAGLRFTRRIALDDNYMFTVTQAVKNSGVAPVTLYPYGLISRSETPETLGFYILHEGLLGVFDGTLLEIDYDDLQEDGKQNVSSTGGWIGITDKYWLMALLPDQSDPFNGRFFHTLRDGTDKYQVDFQRGAVVVPAGGTAEVTDRLFAGAKEVQLINEYDEEFEIVRFDLVIDWGWYPFLTKPIFIALDYFNRWLGNFGLAILLLTVIIKALFFPLANKSYKAMS
ncbi:MAG: membrane protein insertase YidC, partial [Alphaproteobacteria bacterium]